MPPAIRDTKNSPTRSSQRAAWISKAIVTNVDLKNYTVDVITEYEGKTFDSIQVGSPYFHTNNGEGITAMPEVGALCEICQPSDEDTPFILSFIGSFEMEFAKQDNLEDLAGEAEVETEELESTLSTPTSTTSTGSSDKNVSSASARGGRPFLNPGDILLRTRDENFIILRRGGVIQIGSTPMCQSIYIPLKNYIRHFCENIETSTPGGVLTWNVQRKEKDPAGEAPILYRLSLRDKAQNDKADIQLKMGHVSDSIRYELSVAPSGISTSTGSINNSKFKMVVDNVGNQTFNMSGSLDYTISGSRKFSVSGSDEVSIGSSRIVKASTESTEITGAHSLKAASSSEEITGLKAIKATQVYLGKASNFSAVLGELLVIWLTKHVHPMWNVPDVQVAELPNILSKNIKVSP